MHYNVFLHYPEVLPQTVFCDPQVVLTKVTELVEYHHKLLHSPDEGVAAESDLVTFRDHGLLSVELLRKFPKHYTEGLFTPHDLLKVLVSVRAIAMTSVGGEFLMPALLPHLDLWPNVQVLSTRYLIGNQTQQRLYSQWSVLLSCGPSFIPNQPIVLEGVHGRGQAIVFVSQLHHI